MSASERDAIPEGSGLERPGVTGLHVQWAWRTERDRGAGIAVPLASPGSAWHGKGAPDPGERGCHIGTRDGHSTGGHAPWRQPGRDSNRESSACAEVTICWCETPYATRSPDRPGTGRRASRASWRDTVRSSGRKSRSRKEGGVWSTRCLHAQVGIRIRVDAVTGHHDRPLHYLGSRRGFAADPASRSRTGDIAVAARSR